MMRRHEEGIRLTHLETGVIATARECAPRGNKWGFYRIWSRRLLVARLLRPMPGRPIHRTYDLDPPLGIEPNIRQDGRWLVTGKQAVAAVLHGKIEALWLEEAR